MNLWIADYHAFVIKITIPRWMMMVTKKWEMNGWHLDLPSSGWSKRWNNHTRSIRRQARLQHCCLTWAIGTGTSFRQTCGASPLKGGSDRQANKSLIKLPQSPTNLLKLKCKSCAEALVTDASRKASNAYTRLLDIPSAGMRFTMFFLGVVKMLSLK